VATLNTLFAIFAASNPEAMKQKLSSSQDKFSFLSKPTSEESWLVIAPNTVTTKELSDALGITDGAVSAAVVVRVESYYGRANNDIWEWIAAKIGVPFGPEA
jgi:hypothetical protein